MIEIPVEETGHQFLEALTDFQRRTAIPGFRPGKAPMNVIRSRYGRELFEETAENIAKKYVKKAIIKEGLKPGGRINMKLLEFGDTKPFRFEVSFPLKPEVQLTNYRGLKVVINDAQITDDDVDMQIKALRRKNLQPVPTDEPAAAVSRLTIKYREVDRSGLPLIGNKTKSLLLEFGSDSLGIGTDEQLIGVRAGEKRLIRTKRNRRPTEEEPHRILNLDEASSLANAGGDILYEVEVEKVENLKMPELDDQFVKSINPKLNTVEDLRRWVRLNLMSFIGERASRMLREEVMNQLLAENPFTMSPRIVYDTLHDFGEKMKFDHDAIHRFIDDYFDEAERDLKCYALLKAIADFENLAVTDEMIEEEFTRMAEYTGQSVASIRSHFADEENYYGLHRKLFENMVLDFVIKHATVERRMMSFSEFARIMSADNSERAFKSLTAAANYNIA